MIYGRVVFLPTNAIQLCYSEVFTLSAQRRTTSPILPTPVPTRPIHLMAFPVLLSAAVTLAACCQNL